MTSSIYALLSMAQCYALVAAKKDALYYNRSPPYVMDYSIKPTAPTSGDPSHPSDQATVAEASAIVLPYAYPEEAALLGG